MNVIIDYYYNFHRDQANMLYILISTRNRYEIDVLFCNRLNYYIYIYTPKKEMQHVKKYNLLQIFNIILNTEISITLH